MHSGRMYTVWDLRQHIKNFSFYTQKLPKVRESLACDLYCNIDKKLVTGLEPATMGCI